MRRCDDDAFIIAAQRASFLLRATVVCLLLCGPQHVLSDSDELVITEWETWKSINGISYDELVRQTPCLKYTKNVINNRSEHMCAQLPSSFSLMCSLCSHSGRRAEEGHLGEEYERD